MILRFSGPDLSLAIVALERERGGVAQCDDFLSSFLFSSLSLSFSRNKRTSRRLDSALVRLLVFFLTRLLAPRRKVVPT